MNALDAVDEATEKVIDLSLQGTFDCIMIYRIDNRADFNIAVFDGHGDYGSCELLPLPGTNTLDDRMNGSWHHGEALPALKRLRAMIGKLALEEGQE